MSDRSPSSRDALDPIGDDDLPRHKRLKKWLRLEAKCPNCGVQAKVRVDRLNQKFRCKRCGTAMYFDRSGKWKLGLPPADTDDIGELAEREQWWNKFPQLKKVAIGGLLLVVLFLVVGLVQRWLLRAGANLPMALQARADFVAEAVVTRNDTYFDLAVAPDSREAADLWRDKMQRKLSNVGRGLGQNYGIKSEVIYENEGSGAATLSTVQVRRSVEDLKGVDQSPHQQSTTLEFLVYWKDVRSEWLVDGAKTLTAK